MMSAAEAREFEALREVAEAAYRVAWERDHTKQCLRYGDPEHSWLRQVLNKWQRTREVAPELPGGDAEGHEHK